jgi:WhiB family redox-sensing transcriptional regulator
MSIAPQVREHGAEVQRRWLRLAGAAPADLPDRDARQGRWKRYARCGPWAEDPDPEMFFPLDADSDDTYRAREICLRCPVRELCDTYGTNTGASGVWGGIYRDRDGRYAPLCDTAGCLRYRSQGKRYCRECLAPIVAAREAREAAERNTRRKTARAADREEVAVA